MGLFPTTEAEWAEYDKRIAALKAERARLARAMSAFGVNPLSDDEVQRRTFRLPCACCRNRTWIAKSIQGQCQNETVHLGMFRVGDKWYDFKQVTDAVVRLGESLAAEDKECDC